MPTLSLAPKTNLKLSSSVVNLARILELPAIALRSMLLNELEQNPALEAEDDLADCECWQFADRHFICSTSAACSTSSGITLSNYGNGEDSFQFTAGPQSHFDVLLSEMNISLPVSEHPIAAEVLACIDGNGFLEETPVTIATRLRVDDARVDAVLKQLQELTPPGFAAINLRECLLAQLDALAGKGISCPHAQEIVGDYLDDLGAHRHFKIARKLKISTEDVERVCTFLRRHLWPHPMRISDPASTEPLSRANVIPDVLIHQNAGIFTAEVLKASDRWLRINPIYRELARRPSSLSDEERSHVVQQLDRAQTLLANLRQRDNTLQRVADSLILRQEAFLRFGPRNLISLTRRDLARDLYLHESTVSRAVLDKTALLPDGSLCPLSKFFDPGQAVHDVLRELVQEEQRPLTDQELAEHLTERGFPVARRTVAKYREQLRIPSHQYRSVLVPGMRPSELTCDVVQ